MVYIGFSVSVSVRDSEVFIDAPTQLWNDSPPQIFGKIHEVIYENDPDLIFRSNGAIEALTAAKQQGKVRFVGFTGHKNPGIRLKMLGHNYPFDTVQMPLNCFDPGFHSFETKVLPEVNRRGMAAV